MPHTYIDEEEVEEHGMCQQVPSKKEGDMWFDCDRRLCIVDDVWFVRYVWEDVALWKIRITAYYENEITDEMRDQYRQFQQRTSQADQQSIRKK